MTTSAPSPDELLARWRSTGDPSALGALFDAVAPELFGISLHLMSDPALAEDALQGTFLAALGHLDRHDPTRPVVPWLVGILRMKVRELRRSRRRTPDPARLSPPRAPADPARAAAASEEEERVRAALAELPEPYRRVALLRWHHGLDPAEIADLEGKPPGTIRSLLSRAMERVRAGLGALAVVLLPAGVRAPRGLAAVRARVLAEAARRPVTAAAVATGGVLVMKKVLVAAVLLVALVGSGYLLLPNRRRPVPPASPDAPDRVRVAAGETSVAPADPEPAAASVAGPAFRGRVVDADGRPATGAEVLVLPMAVEETIPASGVPADRRATADADGSFALAAPAGAAAVLVVRAPGFAPKVLRGVRPGDAGELSLDRGFAIEGTVTDGEGGAVAGATVEVIRVAETFRLPLTAVTGEDGRYRVDGIPTFRRRDSWYYPFDEVLTRVTAPGFASTPGLIPRDSLTGARPGDTLTLDIPLSPGRELTGRVVRGKDGGPLAGARVVALALGASSRATYIRSDGVWVGAVFGGDAPSETVAAEDGSFRFEHLPATAIQVHAEVEGLYGEPLLLDSTAGREPVRFELYAAATLEGRVVDADGRPVAGAYVWPVDPAGKEARSSGEPTDPNGGYEQVFSPRGEWVWRVMARRYRPLPGLEPIGDPPAVRVMPGERVEVPDIVLAPAGAILRVAVVDESGRPVADARVLEVGIRPQAVSTDAAGLAEVELPEAGETRWIVRAPGFGPAAFTADPLAEGVAERRVVLTAEHVLRGRVLHDDGSPAAGAMVTAADARVPVDAVFPESWPAEGDRDLPPLAVVGSAVTAEDGTFRIGELPKGPFQVEARVIRENRQIAPLRRIMTGVRGWSIEIRLPPDELSPVVPVLKLTDLRTGGAIAEATVWIDGPEGTIASAKRTKTADGEIRLPEVPAGEHDLHVRQNGYLPFARTIRFAPGMEPIRVELDPGVTVRGQFAAAVAGARFERVDGGADASLAISADGRWTASGLTPGVYRMHGISDDRTILVPRGQRLLEIPEGVGEVEFRPELVPGGTLSVALRDERLPRASGTGTEEEIAFGAASRLSVVDAGGRTVFTRAGVQRRGLTPWSRIDLAPGAYAVVLETPAGTRREPVAIEAGATASVALR